MSPDVAPHHAVQFYGSDESLFATVGGFLCEGLITGQPAIVIATDSHRDGIITELQRRMIDVERAQAVGNLTVLDAHELLETFLFADMPDAFLFEKHIGGLIERITAGRRTVVRAYGEMVDVLWKDGRTEAALALEFLWNKLALQQGFALLCGYSMGHFYKRSEQMQQIGAHHADVRPADSRILPFDPPRTRTA